MSLLSTPGLCRDGFTLPEPSGRVFEVFFWSDVSLFLSWCVQVFFYLFSLENGVTEFATSLIRFFPPFFCTQNTTGFYSVETDEIGLFLCLSAGSCSKSRCFGVGLLLLCAAAWRWIVICADWGISFAWYSSSLFVCSLELDIKTDFARCAMFKSGTYIYTRTQLYPLSISAHWTLRSRLLTPPFRLHTAPPEP